MGQLAEYHLNYPFARWRYIFEAEANWCVTFMMTMSTVWRVIDGVDGLKQTGIVQLFQIISGHVDVGRPIMTISGDRQLARFGANVLVSRPTRCRSTSDMQLDWRLSTPLYRHHVSDQKVINMMERFSGVARRNITKLDVTSFFLVSFYCNKIVPILHKGRRQTGRSLKWVKMRCFDLKI